MADQQGPISLAEVEDLIRRLYTGVDVSHVQSVLQTFQRSQQGWLLADELLQNQDSHVRFFGALTFTVKINNDWSTLSSQDANDLLDRLLSRLIQLVNANDVRFVIRKLCSTLVAYFQRPAVRWDRCVRHLVCCMHAGDVVSQDDLGSMRSTVDLLSTLDARKVKAVLSFTVILVEDVGKTDPSSAQTYMYHDTLLLSLDDSVAIIHKLISQSDINPEVAEEAIKCVQPWVMYGYRVQVNRGFTLGLATLRSLVPPLLNCLSIEPLHDVAMDCFINILQSFPGFLLANHLASLATVLSDASAQDMVSALRVGESGEDAHVFSRLLFAFGEASVQELAKNTDDPAQVQVVQHLIELVNCEGFDLDELQICSFAVEFWATFAEHVVDETFEEDQEPQWVGVAKKHIVKALEQGWTRIRLPPEDVWVALSSDTKAEFKILRKDVQDLVQASNVLLGLSIFETFVNLALRSIDDQAWSDVEAALYCLKGLADATDTNAEVDGLLSKLFGSQLFSASTITSGQVPFKTQQTALDTLANFELFFERQSKLLPQTLTYLFHCLDNTNLANAAAGAIFCVCSSCDEHLVGEVGNFLNAYRAIQQKDVTVKEKVIGAITKVIGAMPQANSQIGPLSELLTFIEQDMASYSVVLETSGLEEAVGMALCSLRCLLSMGKALQSPEDAVIDLTADEQASSPDASVWGRPPGQDLQSRLTRLLQSADKLFVHDNDIVETTCLVLRTGYKETQQGLFKLPPRMTVAMVDFAFHSGFESPKLSQLVDAAATMLIRRQYASADFMDSAAFSLLQFLVKYIPTRNNDPSNDPETAASCINLVKTMVPEYFDIMFHPNVIQTLTIIIDFSLRCLVNPDVMPKRAAAALWTSLLARHDLPPYQKPLLSQLIATSGPNCANILIRSIAGECARSELETLAEPLKTMIFAQMQAPTWINSALNNPQVFPCELSTPQKEQWFHQIIRLRGGRGTVKLVKDLWMGCRGEHGALPV